MFCWLVVSINPVTLFQSICDYPFPGSHLSLKIFFFSARQDRCGTFLDVVKCVVLKMYSTLHLYVSYSSAPVMPKGRLRYVLLGLANA